MTEAEKETFMKIKDRHEYFTRDDRFEETNDFEKECLFEIGYLTQIIEKLQKENEELKLKDYYLPAWVTKKYVSKDKIRELFKELYIIEGSKYAKNKTTDNDKLYKFANDIEKLLEEE